MTMTLAYGRCVQLIEGEAVLRNENGELRVRIDGGDAFGLGDLVEVKNGQARLLTPNRSPGRSMRWMDRVLDPRRLRALRVRDQVETAIRQHFRSRGFHETRTPLLVPSPGMEPHIRPFALKTGSYLPTSPEFAMKRLLVGGLERIFQISQAFRLEPKSSTHHPEFTLLEWYRAYAGYEKIMRDVEELFCAIAESIHGEPVIQYQGRRISLQTPWPKLRIRELYGQLGIDLAFSDQAELRSHCRRLGLKAPENASWDDLFFLIWLNVIEPSLPSDRAVIVMRYPASQAALSVIDQDPDGSKWARRFEVYAGGLELGNAFEELTDPAEQRMRFTRDMDLRERTYGPSFPRCPIDEEFLSALDEGMPPSGGIAMGVDRIAMLFADEPEIDRLLWLESYVGNESSSAGGGSNAT